MRTRTASLAFAIVAAVALVAGPVAARSSTPVSITLDVHFDPESEVITAQTNFCDGTAESDAWISGGGRLELLRAGWTAADVAFSEPPSDVALRGRDGPVAWTSGETTYTVTPMTLGTYFGPGTPWGHVLAVMRALAGRYGDDGVRLVVALD